MGRMRSIKHLIPVTPQTQPRDNNPAIKYCFETAGCSKAETTSLSSKIQQNDKNMLPNMGDTYASGGERGETNDYLKA